MDEDHAQTSQNPSTLSTTFSDDLEADPTTDEDVSSSTAVTFRSRRRNRQCGRVTSATNDDEDDKQTEDEKMDTSSTDNDDFSTNQSGEDSDSLEEDAPEGL